MGNLHSCFHRYIYWVRHTHTHTHLHSNTKAYTHAHFRTQAHTHTCIHTHINKHLQIPHIHEHMLINKHKHSCAQTHTYKNESMKIYMNSNAPWGKWTSQPLETNKCSHQSWPPKKKKKGGGGGGLTAIRYVLSFQLHKPRKCTALFQHLANILPSLPKCSKSKQGNHPSPTHLPFMHFSRTLKIWEEKNNRKTASLIMWQLLKSLFTHLLESHSNKFSLHGAVWQQWYPYSTAHSFII